MICVGTSTVRLLERVARTNGGRDKTFCRLGSCSGAQKKRPELASKWTSVSMLRCRLGKPRRLGNELFVGSRQSQN